MSTSCVVSQVTEGHHVVVIPVAKFAPRIHEQLRGEIGLWTEAHDHQNVGPPIAGKVMNITQKAVGVVAVISRAPNIDGGGRIKFPCCRVIRSYEVQGAAHHFVVAILVQISGGDPFGIENIRQLPGSRVSGFFASPAVLWVRSKMESSLKRESVLPETYSASAAELASCIEGGRQPLSYPMDMRVRAT